MSADLIIYGIVAAGLVLWLRNLLGTKHGEERQRPNPFVTSEEKILEVEALKEQTAVGSPQPQGPEERITAFVRDSEGPFGVDNKTAESGLIAIAKADKTFDPAAFLSGAQDAFVMIVEAFAAGDRETLEYLLDGSVYHAFDTSLSEREALGQTQKADIHAIRKAQIIEAQLDNSAMARITIRFEAEETTVTRDAQGNIIDGDPDKTTHMRDIWTFSRKVRDRDPRWIVTETRGDHADEENIRA